jgi:hypothetical protein
LVGNVPPPATVEIIDTCPITPLTPNSITTASTLRYLKIDWFQKFFAPELKDSFDFIMLYFMDCFRAQIQFFM